MFLQAFSYGKKHKKGRPETSLPRSSFAFIKIYRAISSLLIFHSQDLSIRSASPAV
jgi:hypothetical protein